MTLVIDGRVPISLEACIEILVGAWIEQEVRPGETCGKGRIIVGQCMGVEKFPGVAEQCQKTSLSPLASENRDMTEGE